MEPTHMDRFLSAVQLLNSSSCTLAERRAAEQWLLSFQRSEQGWPVCTQLLQQGSSVPYDVQLLAAQTLRTITNGCPPEARPQLQPDLLQLLGQQQQGLARQVSSQVCLALSSASLASQPALQALMAHAQQALPPQLCLLLLETLADEALGSWTPYSNAGKCAMHATHWTDGLMSPGRLWVGVWGLGLTDQDGAGRRVRSN